MEVDILSYPDPPYDPLAQQLTQGVIPDLVLLYLKLGYAERKLDDDPDGGAALLAEARQELARTLDELRQSAHGRTERNDH